MYISILSLTLALNGVGGQRRAPAALTPGKGPGTHTIRGWVGLSAGGENFAATGTRSPDCPARSESVYRLSYPGPTLRYKYSVKLKGN